MRANPENAPLTPALLSIHDVMPETLDRVERILDFCETADAGPVTLLVVPGRAWQANDIDRLRSWQQAGHELAAHGWHHRIPRYGGVYHQLHAALLSRNVAEHLALRPEEVEALMGRSQAWFATHDLPAPSLYVPPAWALGRLPAGAFSRLPFARIEVLRGLIELPAGRLDPLPLVGFEADTAWRAAILGGWNRLQQRRARMRRRPLRIGIHPDDPDLRLGRDLRELLGSPFDFRAYGQ